VRTPPAHGRRARSRSWPPVLGAFRLGLPLVAVALAGGLTASGVEATGAAPSAVRSSAVDQLNVRLGESDAETLDGPAAVVPHPVVVNGRVQPVTVSVPRAATGRYDVVPSGAAANRGGPIVRYRVEVEHGLAFDRAEFAAEVHRILNHERGWGRAGGTRFVRVHSGPVRFRVSLSSPQLTDRQCYSLRTFGRVSCWNGSRAVINALRWAQGAPTYGRDVASYREYVISHEVGHALGRGHVGCPGRGQPAPVMVQQTKSLYGCAPNPWPYR